MPSIVCLQGIRNLPPALVPPCLAAACPQLHTLCLQKRCTWLGMPPSSQPAALFTAPSTPVYPDLHTLEVEMDHLPLQTLTDGLQTLPNLTSLKLAANFLLTPPQAYQSAVEATCGHLTWLEVKAWGVQLRAYLQAPSVLSKLQHLRELHIPYEFVSDAGMCALLELPRLTHLAVDSFELSSSHAHKPCSWQELIVCDYLEVLNLSKLPLQGLCRLVAGRLVSNNAATLAADDVAAALANLPASCHLTAPSHGMLELDCGSWLHHQTLLLLLLPVLARWEGVRALRINVDGDEDEDVANDGQRLLQPDTITAIASHLTHMPSCTALRLDNWIPHPACQLITALRPTHITRLVISGYSVQEQHLLLWCCGDAGRDMTVEVLDGCHVKPSGGLQRVREYLQQVKLHSADNYKCVKLLGVDDG